MGIMKVYVVERFLVGWSADEVHALMDSLDADGPQFAQHGVRHIETIHIPGDETCLSVFAGPDLEAVRAANDDCDLPVGRVLEAVTRGR